MKRYSVVLALGALAVCAATTLVSAQDNPVPGFGTAGGSNARTYVFQAPIGAPDSVKWKKDMATVYGTRRGAYGAMVFDESGDLYFTGFVNAAVPNSGLIKVHASDGSFAWASPLVDVVASGMSPIVGADAAYSARCDDANPTVYALNKATGAVIWESDPLPMRVELSMALYNGILYGVTRRDGTSGNCWAFAIQASDGTILHATSFAAAGDVQYGDTALVPDAFGAGEHGLYWFHDNGNATGTSVYGIQISNSTASVRWTYPHLRAYPSHVMYNQVKDAIYTMHWGDYGSTVEAFAPVTGATRWIARNVEFGNSFNGGFYPTHTLKPDGSSFIFAGFSGDLNCINDPGDLAGANLPVSNRQWYYDGLDAYSESQTTAVLVTNGTDEAFISGTSANQTANVKRALYVQDGIGGGRLVSWVNPDDVAPYSGSYNFRSISVGPDGTVYYMDPNEGPQGTLYAMQIRPFVAPVVAAVTPDPDTAAVFTEYTKQLELSGGDPAGRWAVTAGPTGLKVSSTGRVYGWTPGKDDIGQTFPIEVQAINPGGSGSQTWGVAVVDPLAGLTVTTRTAPDVGASSTSLVSDGVNLYFHREDTGTLYKSVDASSWVPLAAAPGGAPEDWDDGALAYGNGMLIGRRNNGTDNVLTVYDIATDTWTQHGNTLFGNTGFVVIGNKVYGNAHANMANVGGNLTIADLTDLDATYCKRAHMGGLLGNDPDWFSRVVQLATTNGMLYGIKNDWVTEPRGTGDRLWGVSPDSLLLNTFYGGNYDNWDHSVTPATDLGLLPFECGYGSALVALPANWAGVVGAQGGLFIVAGRTPSNWEGFGAAASDLFAIYDFAAAKFVVSTLPGPTGSGTSATFHNGHVYIKRGGDPDILYNNEIWVVGPFEPSPPMPDLNNDTHVDGFDLDILQNCIAGSGPTVLYDPNALPPGCDFLADYESIIQADFDRDGDVDQDDFGVLQRCWTGPTLTFDPNCVN